MVLLSMLLLGVGMTRRVLPGTQPPRGSTPAVIIVPSGQAQSADRPQRQPWQVKKARLGQSSSQFEKLRKWYHSIIRLSSLGIYLYKYQLYFIPRWT